MGRFFTTVITRVSIVFFIGTPMALSDSKLQNAAHDQTQDQTKIQNFIAQAAEMSFSCEDLISGESISLSASDLGLTASIPYKRSQDLSSEAVTIFQGMIKRYTSFFSERVLEFTFNNNGEIDEILSSVYDVYDPQDEFTKAQLLDEGLDIQFLRDSNRCKISR